MKLKTNLKTKNLKTKKQQRINETKILLLEKMNKINKLRARLEKKEKTKLTSIRKETETNLVDISTHINLTLR